MLFTDISGSSLSIAYRGIIGISKDIHVTAGNHLQFLANADIYLINGAELFVDDGASLDLGDNVTLYAVDGICKLVVNGSFTFGSNINLHAEGDEQIWLVINNTALNLSMNSAEFENGVIIAYNNQLSLTHPTFSNSGIYGYNGSFNIIDGEFDHSFAFFRNASSNSKVININGCNFTGDHDPAIDIDNYPNFRIDNCNINGYTSAISLDNCGYGTGFQQISNCELTDNSYAGINLYRTYSDILHNVIRGNLYGIRCLDRCNTHIEGNHQNVSQEISDNTRQEVYATRGSFPQYFHWNLVQDNSYPGYPLIEYSGPEVNLDIRNNCWGAGILNPQEDLVPPGSYIWNPPWLCLGGSGSGSSSGAEALYFDARENIESEDFASAKAGFEQIVGDYPESIYAQAAMKEIYSLEELTGNNYNALKLFYDTDTTIQNNEELAKLADFLANFCDIKLENYPSAIAWFEDVIQNPESMEDSIFAIIDLGYTYFLMENGQKSSFVGNMPQYKPVSVEQFQENRDYLLSLLPGDKLSETMKESIGTLGAGKLLQNVPNPFNNTTQIWYKLDEEALVAVHVYDYTGKRVSTINPGRIDKGSHYIEFSSADLPSGIYFYTLQVNGRVSDSKKMTVVR